MKNTRGLYSGAIDLIPNVTVYKDAYLNYQELVDAMHAAPSGPDYILSEPGQWHDDGDERRSVKDRYISEREDDSAYLLIQQLFSKIDSLLVDFSGRHGVEFDVASYSELEVRYYQAPTAVAWHSDLDLVTDGPEQPNYSVTINCYLNDDYAGGEIAFKYDDTDELVAYKPQPGDILIFPSSSPLRHRVHWVTSGRRYYTNIMLIESNRPSWHLDNKP